MKRITYMSAILALLVLAGCSSKEPEIDAIVNKSGNSSIDQMPNKALEQGNTTASTNLIGEEKNNNTSVISPVTTASSIDSNANATNNSSKTTSDKQDILSIYFDYDKFEIREDMQTSLKANGGLVKNKTFKLEGNCDEFGSDEYNFALGLKRASSVKSALVESGVSADTISMTSLGEGNPACLEKTQECWAKNRRVDFKLQ
jgi:peptidoglycan-associated lipoprotein